MVHTTSTLNDPRSRSRSRSSSHGGDLNSRRQSPPLQTSLRRSPRLHPQKNMRTPLRRSPRFASQINDKETDETDSPSVKMMKTGRVLRSSVRGINPIKKNSVRKDQPRCLKKCHCELPRRSPRFSGNFAKGTDKEYFPRNEVIRTERVLRSRLVTKVTVPVKEQANGDFVVRRSLRIANENSVGLNKKNETSKHQKVNKLENKETKAGTKRTRSTNAYPEICTPEDGKARKKSKNEIHSNKDEEIDEDEVQNCSHVDGWTKEQDEALRRAYFTAMPSPNFWKMVSKMVPGKSAKECFDRVHSDHATPPIPQPRSRVKRPNISPIGSLTLLNDKSIEHVLPNSKLPKTNRHNTLVARRTARHLLRKHCLLDQNKEADFFSVFETSPLSFTIDIPEIETPGTSESKLSSPGILWRCNKRSKSEHNKMLSRLRTENQLKTESPEVLKQIKNVALHERYIDHLRCRESKRRASTKTVSTSAYFHCQNGPSKACMLKAAKSALMCEAKDVINQFQNKQANVFDNDEELDLGSGSDNNDDE